MENLDTNLNPSQDSHLSSKRSSKKKLVITIVILVSFALLIGAGVLVFYTFTNQSVPQVPIESNFNITDEHDQNFVEETSQSSKNDISNWLIFTVEEFSFSFNFHPDWKVAEEIGPPYRPPFLYSTFVQTGNNPLKNTYEVTVYDMTASAYIDAVEEVAGVHELTPLSSKGLSGSKFIRSGEAYVYVFELRGHALVLEPRGFEPNVLVEIEDDLDTFVRSFSTL